MEWYKILGLAFGSIAIISFFSFGIFLLGYSLQFISTLVKGIISSGKEIPSGEEKN